MPICIAGMHRSGTSLLSRLLNHCGLYLGPDADILPAEPSNTEGHWENTRFIDINEALLSQSRCTWNFVRPVDDRWELASCHDAAREHAEQLVATFAGREPWGWKDPRNSLTLPFWLRLLPDLKVIICVRHPLEVAASLHARDNMPATVGIRLWLDYAARLMNDVPAERRLVVHYQSLLCDPRAELARAMRFAEISVSDDALASVANLPKGSMRHHRLPFASLLEPHLPVELASDYVNWCSQAGPSCQRWLRADLAAIVGQGLDAGESERFFAGVAARLKERERHAIGVECDELERHAHAIKMENLAFRAAGEDAQRYVRSLEAAHDEAERYAHSLLAENATLKAMCAESERYARSLEAERQKASSRFAEVERYARSLEEALKARRSA